MRVNSKKIIAEYIANKGLESDIYIKPIDKALSKFGLNCRPMIFWEFWIAMIFWTICFGTSMFLMFGFVIFRGDEKSRLDAILLVGFAGFIFGTFIAWKNRRDRIRLNLPSWKEILAKK